MASDVDAPPIIGEAQPANADRLCRMETWRKGKQIVIAAVPVDGSPPDYFIKATIQASGGGQQRMFEMTKFVPGCKTVEEAFERWAAEAEAGKRDLIASQARVQPARMQIPPAALRGPGALLPGNRH